MPPDQVESGALGPLLPAGYTTPRLFTATWHSPEQGYVWEFEVVRQGADLYLVSAQLLPQPGGLLTAASIEAAGRFVGFDLRRAILAVADVSTSRKEELALAIYRERADEA